MVDVAQLVEPRIVIPAVAGSNPVVHPKFYGASPVRRAPRLLTGRRLFGARPEC